MCVDYIDLNKHCPKDPFGLPQIDQVINSTAGCDLLCFLGCYSGYHQISIKEEDQEKTAFITPFGAYCYMTMSFGLKNAGATYQRAIQACLKRQLNKNIEAYVDDVVVKTRNSYTLIADLEETFASLREYRWKLNLNKCVFGVPSGKLLGFIISHCGIEANPEKISAITSLKAPTCIKDLHKLTGCMAALNRFISKLGERRLLFFKLLKHQEKFAWTPEADQALSQLKDFLSKPPVVTAPRKKEPLLLYLAVNTHVVSTSRAAGRRPHLPSPATSLLCQRGPVRIQGTLSTRTEATVCSAHHLAEATTLLPGVLDLHRHRLPAQRHLAEPRCY
jgi:dsDNA-binding SOS-regulon protein